ncbi:MAG: M24 family metallopeptidase, partial [Anaerolineales bacterium]|nr:M24 family metallopeptidase [Anaerolineales bacterium]
MNLVALQAFMQDRRIDAWLIYDFRGSNPVLSRLVTMGTHLTRRVLLLIPAHGQPRLAVSPLDHNQFKDAEFPRELYLGWRGLHDWLSTNLAGYSRIAMEYSPGGNLPICSFVDCGTVEMVRALGVEVVSSADLVQVSAACWGGKEVVERHLEANCKVAGVKDAAFAFIAQQHRAGRNPLEHEVAQFIRDQFQARDLQFPDGPIVGVNAHSGDPHFEPSADHPTHIKPGDWILIDLWARLPGDHNIHSDITWVGYAGRQVPDIHRKVFNAVKAARDAAVREVQSAFAAGRAIQGWQLDDAARQPIIDAGFGDYIKHRTGHSLSPGPKVHGLGANLDNMETRDTRQIMPDTGFTIEPGIYLPDFG